MDVDSSVCIIIYANNVLAGLELVVGSLNDIPVTPPPPLVKSHHYASAMEVIAMARRTSLLPFPPISDGDGMVEA